MTSDNFAVSSEGIVRLVDLEHVIVVDKYPRGKTIIIRISVGYSYSKQHQNRQLEFGLLSSNPSLPPPSPTEFPHVAFLLFMMKY